MNLRESMNIVSGMLDEDVVDNRLYHGTSIIGFCFIAHENMLGAYGGEGQASFSLEPTVAQSFTRVAIEHAKEGQLAQYSDFYSAATNGWHAEKFVAYQAEILVGAKGVVLAFDRKKLHAAYEFHAVNFESPEIPTVDMGYSGREREEAVFENIRNLDQFLTGLSIDRATFQRYAEFVREKLPNDQQALSAVAAGEALVNRFGH